MRLLIFAFLYALIYFNLHNYLWIHAIIYTYNDSLFYLCIYSFLNIFCKVPMMSKSIVRWTACCCWNWSRDSLTIGLLHPYPCIKCFYHVYDQLYSCFSLLALRLCEEVHAGASRRMKKIDCTAADSPGTVSEFQYFCTFTVQSVNEK